MPDVSMCSGDGCPIREECYRHTATPTPMRQSWFVTPPLVSAEPFVCEYFSPVFANQEPGDAGEGR